MICASFACTQFECRAPRRQNFAAEKRFLIKDKSLRDILKCLRSSKFPEICSKLAIVIVFWWLVLTAWHSGRWSESNNLIYTLAFYTKIVFTLSIFYSVHSFLFEENVEMIPAEPNLDNCTICSMSSSSWRNTQLYGLRKRINSFCSNACHGDSFICFINLIGKFD